jgi:hypothetical protein
MTLKTFTTLIEGIQKQDDKVHELYKHGVDLLSFNYDYYKDVILPLMIEVFGKEGMDWIDWYVCEKRENPEKLRAWDKEGNEICQNIKSLYKEVMR